jgi:hypothetical protein
MDFNNLFKMNKYYNSNINFNNYYFLDTRDIFKNVGITNKLIKDCDGFDNLKKLHKHFFNTELITHHIAIEDAKTLQNIFNKAKKEYKVNVEIKEEIEVIDKLRKINDINMNNYKKILKEFDEILNKKNNEILKYYIFCKNCYISSSIKNINDIINYIQINKI